MADTYSRAHRLGIMAASRSKGAEGHASGCRRGARNCDGTIRRANQYELNQAVMRGDCKMLYVRLGKSLRAISQCISNEDYTDVWTTNTVIVDKHEVPCRSVVAETAERPSSSFDARDMQFPMLEIRKYELRDSSTGVGSTWECIWISKFNQPA